MKKEHFTKPMTFNATELEARKDKARDRIVNGYFDNRIREWRYPAVDHLILASYEELVKSVADRASKGNELFTGHPLRAPMPGFYEVFFYKTPAEVNELLEATYQQVEREYLEEIEEDKKAKTELLANQLYEQQQAKARKAEEQKEIKARESAMKEATAYVSSLLQEAK